LRCIVTIPGLSNIRITGLHLRNGERLLTHTLRRSKEECPAIGALLAPAGIYRGNVVPSKGPPWFPLPTNTVQDLADVLLEGCCFPARKSKINEKNLVLPSKAVKRNPIWMRAQKLSKALLRYSAGLRFEPAPFLPTTNLSGCNVKKVRKTVDRENRESMNFVYRIIKPRNFRPDGFHAMARASRD
jgi:hypothetical protein